MSIIPPIAVPSPRRRPVLTPEQRSQFDAISREYLRTGNRPKPGTPEHRAMELGVTAEGGAFATTEFVRTVREEIESRSFLRSICTVFDSSRPLKMPYETDMGEAAYLDEEGAYSEDLPAFSAVSSTPFKATSIQPVSEELVQDFDGLEDYLGGLFGRRFAALEERKFLTGGGTTEPTGLVTQVTTEVTTAGATAITLAELAGVMDEIPAAYLPAASWVMSPAAWVAVVSLDSNAVTPAVEPMSVGRIWGRPVFVSGFMAGLTTGATPILFGDFSAAVVQAGQYSFQRLDELYAGSGLVGFRAFMRHDCRLSIGDAIAKVTMA